MPCRNYIRPMDDHLILIFETESFVSRFDGASVILDHSPSVLSSEMYECLEGSVESTTLLGKSDSSVTHFCASRLLKR